MHARHFRREWQKAGKRIRQAGRNIFHAVWAAQLRLPSDEAHAETSNRWDRVVVIYQVVPSLPACRAMLKHDGYLKMSFDIVKKGIDVTRPWTQVAVNQW